MRGLRVRVRRWLHQKSAGRVPRDIWQQVRSFCLTNRMRVQLQWYIELRAPPHGGTGTAATSDVLSLCFSCSTYYCSFLFCVLACCVVSTFLPYFVFFSVFQLVCYWCHVFLRLVVCIWDASSYSVPGCGVEFDNQSGPAPRYCYITSSSRVQYP